MTRNRIALLLLPAVMLALSSCKREPAPKQVQIAPRPSILLVTLDTTRADSIGPEAIGIETPSFNALAAHGKRFRWAYAAVPQTLPSHTSMMTGIYPAGHGLHENGRYLSTAQSLVAEKLHTAGYRTAAFVSAFALARRFGLARGFDTYDDEVPEPRNERSAQATTDRALALFAKQSPQPLFLWVHYYEPHFPYEPPEPFRTRFAAKPYLGEIAAMDAQLGRLVAAFQQRFGRDAAIIVAGDHGEGLGEHGEAQHGNLLYQATMHVPLVVAGPRAAASVSETPVSTRRIFHTILDWAGIDSTNSLLRGEHETVAAEAMKPFLDYGWRPQVMAVDGRYKAILAGPVELYDVVADPSESHDLGAVAQLTRDMRTTLREYPVPSLEGAATAEPPNVSDEERRKLASLGYVASTTKPVIRAGAPRPADMTRLFAIEDQAAAFFVRNQYAQAIPLLNRILSDDPYNLDAALHLGTCYEMMGRGGEALAAYEKAQTIAPQSQDVRQYLGLHYARGTEWQRAVPLLEKVVAESPDRIAAAEGLAFLRGRQGRVADQIALLQRVYTLRTPTASELIRLGEMSMQSGQTAAAIDAFEKARAAQGNAFGNDLELGVLYLAANRLEDARAALDRVSPSNAGYAMALFKRAQVSVLLHEPDSAARIDAARAHSNPMTRELIARERLFR
ncbi:MAG: choline-sulfatase [Thermoanaerobaculia bacterium]|jgi:arylsulfatase A-like enzyme/tetratricopeptide (TPR) repeat protein|nr:choline-sulfatase [Thermoanaerobaculia bacterium]